MHPSFAESIAGQEQMDFIPRYPLAPSNRLLVSCAKYL